MLYTVLGWTHPGTGRFFVRAIFCPMMRKSKFLPNTRRISTQLIAGRTACLLQVVDVDSADWTLQMEEWLAIGQANGATEAELSMLRAAFEEARTFLRERERTMSAETERRCCYCHKSQPVSEFARHHGTKLTASCKECRLKFARVRA